MTTRDLETLEGETDSVSLGPKDELPSLPQQRGQVRTDQHRMFRKSKVYIFTKLQVQSDFNKEINVPGESWKVLLERTKGQRCGTGWRRREKVGNIARGSRLL